MEPTTPKSPIRRQSWNGPVRSGWIALFILMAGLFHPGPRGTFASGHDPCLCDYQHPGSDTTITVDNLADLQYAINGAAASTTILVEPGLYDLRTSPYAGWGIGIEVWKSNVTIRSSTGNRADVVFDGGGMADGIAKAFLVADYLTQQDTLRNITFADVTIRNASNHLISVQGEFHPRNITIHNVHCVNAGQQLIKVNPESLSDPVPVSNGAILCSRIEYETHLHEGYYTQGIDIHAGDHWTIRNDTLRNIRAHPESGAIGGPAILVWTNSVGTIVERNVVIDCDRGIVFGDWSHSGYPFLDHTGGAIRGNVVRGYEHANPEGSMGSYESVSIGNTAGALVANNTLYAPGDVDRGIDVVGPYVTGCEIVNNLMDKEITLRAGALEGANTWGGNLEHAGAENYADAPGGDFHLAPASEAIDSGTVYAGLSVDIDCDPVTDGSPDAGADEFASGTAVAAGGGAVPSVRLDGIRPNPFNPSTTVAFALDRPSNARLTIHDAGGRLVRTLIDGGAMDAGAHRAVWDGRDDRGREAASGVYFCRLAAGGEEAAGRMVLLR